MYRAISFNNEIHRSDIAGLVVGADKNSSFWQIAKCSEPGIIGCIRMGIIKIVIIACKEISPVFRVAVENLKFPRLGDIARTIINENCYFLRINLLPGINNISGIIRDRNYRRLIVDEPVICRAGFGFGAL